MSKLLASTALAVVLLLSVSAFAKFTKSHADILTCTVSGTWAKIQVEYIATIVPVSFDELVNDDYLLMARSANPIPQYRSARPEIISSFIGVARIDWNGESHKFIQTQPGNDSGWSLMGFFIDSKYPTVVIVDGWKDNKPIYVYEPYMHNNEVLSGYCK